MNSGRGHLAKDGAYNGCGAVAVTVVAHVRTHTHTHTHSIVIPGDMTGPILLSC